MNFNESDTRFWVAITYKNIKNKNTLVIGLPNAYIWEFS